MWLTLRGNTREDSPQPPSPQHLRRHSIPFPSFPISYIVLPKTPLKVAGLQGGNTAQGRDSPSQTVLHILCSLISTDKTWPPCTSEHLWAGGEGDVTEMALHNREEARQTRHEARWLVGKTFLKEKKSPTSNFLEERKQNQTIYPVLSKHKGKRRCKNISL